MKKDKYILICGGTGGHVIPAVNFGNFLISKGHSCNLILDKRGKKYAFNFKGKIYVINASHFSKGFIGRIKSSFLLIIGLFQSFFYLIKLFPNKGIAFGSYASAMPLLVLIFFKQLGLTKIYLHEQNSVIGKVNLFFSRFAEKIFLNFENTKNLINKYENKYFFSGLPQYDNTNYVLRNIDNKDSSLTKILIIGGSQGAANLNVKLIEILIKLKNNIRRNIKISIQCPSYQIKIFKQKLENANIESEFKSFFEDINKKLKNSDLLISRAGAGTIHDVVFNQIPCIFIPLMISADDHQSINANYLSNKNAAIKISENDLDQYKTYQKFKNIIEDNEEQIKIIKNLQKINILDTNQLIYKEIGKL